MIRYRWPAVFVAVVALAACVESDDIVFTADEVTTPARDAPTGVVPTTVADDPSASGVVIDRIWSPEPAIAQVTGTGAAAADTVTVGLEPADVLVFEVGAGGSFTLRVRIPEIGAHTICIGDECGRVFIAEGVVVPTG